MSTETKMKKTILSMFTTLFLLMATLPLVHAESMPDNVLSRVKEQTSAEYPGNYAVQKLMLDEQKKAYKFLSTYVPKSVPPDILKKIKEDAASQYTDNYAVQKMIVEEQVKAYLELNK